DAASRGGRDGSRVLLPVQRLRRRRPSRERDRCGARHLRPRRGNGMSSPRGPSAAMRSLYEEMILDHFRKPRFRGELEGGCLSIHKLNPSCGDEITLQLRLTDGRIEDARFTGQGCSISQASASMMLSILRGKTTREAHEVSARFREMLRGDAAAAKDPLLGDLRALAGVALHPARVRCAMLGW